MESAVARGGCWQRPAVDVTGCWFAETEVWELVNIKRKTQNKGASFSNYKEMQLLPGYHTSLVGSLLFTTVASSRIIFCCLTRWPRKFFRRWGASARKCKLRSPLQGWGHVVRGCPYLVATILHNLHMAWFPLPMSEVTQSTDRPMASHRAMMSKSMANTCFASKESAATKRPKSSWQVYFFSSLITFILMET